MSTVEVSLHWCFVSQSTHIVLAVAAGKYWGEARSATVFLIADVSE